MLRKEHDVTQTDSARAFNRGSDARLAGQPLLTNPYHDTDILMRRTWDEGWRFTDRNWGRDAHWPVRRLPDVMEVA